MSNPLIIAIDDDENNLELIESWLEDQPMELMTTTDPKEGIQLVRNHHERVHLILLDRMMPEIDGIEVIKLLHQEEKLRKIPIIMQSAAVSQEQIREGIENKVYYYLTKPYSKEMLNTVVTAALREYEHYRQLVKELMQHKLIADYINEMNLSFKYYHQVDEVALLLSNFFPEPEKTILGISEVLANAVEHGNLKISYDEKTELINEGVLLDEINARHKIPENEKKQVNVHLVRDVEGIKITIEDEGDGFEWQQYLSIDPERSMHNHGRGIALANLTSFDEMSYKGKGNIVTCMKKL